MFFVFPRWDVSVLPTTNNRIRVVIDYFDVRFPHFSLLWVVAYGTYMSTFAFSFKIATTNLSLPRAHLILDKNIAMAWNHRGNFFVKLNDFCRIMHNLSVTLSGIQGFRH